MKALQEDSLVWLRTEAAAGEGAGMVIMEGFKYQDEMTEPCLSSDCCCAMPTACRPFPPKHATTARTQVIKSESTASFLKLIPPFNFPLAVIAPFT